MINNTLIEALVSPGLKRKPEFVWGANANDLKTIIGHLAEGHAYLPIIGADPAKMSAEIGLAFAVANVFDRSQKSVWDQSELRRIATIAMQMGYEICALFSYLPHTGQYLQVYLEDVLEKEVANPEVRSIQAMCLAAVMVANMDLEGQGENALAITGKSILAGYADQPHHQAKIQQIQSLAVAQECRARTTADFARIASMLFVEAGRTYDPLLDDDMQPGQQTEPQEPQAKEQPQQQSDSSGERGDVEASSDGSAQLNKADSQESDNAQNGGDQDGVQAQDDSLSRLGEDAKLPAEPSLSDGQKNGNDSADATDGQKAKADYQSGDPSGQADGQAAEAGDSQAQATESTSEAQVEVALADAHQAEAKADPAASELSADDVVNYIQADPEAAQAAEGEDVAALMFSGGDQAGGEPLGAHNSVRKMELDVHVDGQLIASIVNAFQDSRTRFTGLRTSGGKVDVKRAWRIRQGDMRVFKTRQDSPGMDMAMSVLVDRSGSMRKCLKEVCGTALAFGNGLGRITGTKCRIAVFPGDTPGSTTTVLSYGENHKLAQERLETLTASGSTPLAQAILYEARQLLERNERRKVIVVLTDGKPDNGQEVLAVISWAESQGIEVVGIGFATAQNIQRWIPNSVFTESLERLPEAIEGIFREKILAAA